MKLPFYYISGRTVTLYVKHKERLQHLKLISVILRKFPFIMNNELKIVS